MVELHEAIRVDMLAPSSDVKAFIRYELAKNSLSPHISAKDWSRHHAMIDEIEEKSNGS